ncbi:MAG: hypothetical protein IKD07_03680 [Clostridia bacterium]|nr:hypothetical protein [Clostridia bacterium]
MTGIVMIAIYYALFFAIPIGTLFFFGISLYRYLSARKANKKNPGTVSEEEIKKRKLLLIVACVIAGVLVAVVIGFIALLFMAIAYM